MSPSMKPLLEMESKILERVNSMGFHFEKLEHLIGVFETLYKLGINPIKPFRGFLAGLPIKIVYNPMEEKRPNPGNFILEVYKDKDNNVHFILRGYYESMDVKTKKKRC